MQPAKQRIIFGVPRGFDKRDAMLCASRFYVVGGVVICMVN